MPNIERDIEVELLFAAYGRKKKNAYLNYGTALTIAVLFMPLFDRELIAIWVVAILAATTLLALDVWWFNRTVPTVQHLQPRHLFTGWQLRFLIQSVCTGLAWSVGPTLMIAQSSGMGLTICLMVLIAVCSIAMNTLAEQPKAMQAFLVSALLPPAIGAAVMGGALEILLSVTFLVAMAQLLVVGRDSNRKMREHLETQRRLRNIFDSAQDAIIEMDTTGKITDWNNRAETIFGYRKAEMLGKNVIDAIVPEQNREFESQRLAQFVAVNTDQTSPQFEMKMLRHDGEVFTGEGSVTTRSAGGLRYCNTFISDITQRKAAETRLALFRRVFDATKQCIAITNGHGRFIYQNRALKQLVGYSDEELLGKNFTTFAVNEVAERFGPSIIDALTKGQGWIGEIPMRRKDGSQFTTLSSIDFVLNEQDLIQYVFIIFTDFTDELARRSEFAKAKDEAERANKAKSEFLAGMSHELRTPMNAILGFAQILEYDDDLSVDQQDSVHEILKGGRHLLALINEVLDLAKIEARRVDLSLEAVNIAELLDECQRLMQPIAAARSVTMHIDVDTGSPASHGAVIADRTRLKQVLLNLLSNAVKYNHEGGEIRVSVGEQADNKRCIYVTDTGPGVTSENVDGLFQAFNRLGAESSEVEGTGIGLTIARELMKLMGGKIGVDSVVGNGSTFWLELPVEGTLSPNISREVVPTPHHPVLHRQKKVLCIDDNPVNLKLLEQMLSKRPQLSVLTAHTPNLGLELAQAHAPDLILLDINMPGMNGYRVLELLQGDEKLKKIPVFAVTANAMPRDIARGLAAGFVQYLTKPLEIIAILKLVDEALGESENELTVNVK